MKTYKVLNENGSAFHGGTGKWPLPNGRPGKWLEVKSKIEPCVRGLHLCRKQDLVHWLGPAIWEAEYEGDYIEVEDKIVVSRARLVSPLSTWNETTARLFAADCAARAVRMRRREGLVIHERVSGAIKTVRRFARGEASQDELIAARSAAWSAAWLTVWSADWSADWSASDNAVWSAARSADWSADWSAAWSAADNAARSASDSAARSAARSAVWSAAWNAAESAVWSAARLAARNAERNWQTRRLFEYLEGKRS